jgi:hypothetical protein
LEVGMLRARHSLVDAVIYANVDATKATAEATKALSLAANFSLELTRQLARGTQNSEIRIPGSINFSQFTQMVATLTPFSGIQFDLGMDINRSDIERVGVRASIETVLQAAGWVIVARQEPPEGLPTSAKDVMIDVGANTALWAAAETLASALNAEGIVTTANQRPEIDTPNASVIHILIGPKAD